MKPHEAILIAALLPALVLYAKDKKQPSLPAVFGQAHSVYVESVSGREFDPSLDAADREAIADVRDALQAWNRYVFTSERQEADLIIVVRKGSEAADGEPGSMDRGPVPRQIPQQVPAGPRVPGMEGTDEPMDASGQPGFSEDLFEVCQLKPNGKLSRALWTGSLRGGLSRPRLILFQQFKEAVERAYPSQPSSPAAKP